MTEQKQIDLRNHSSQLSDKMETGKEYIVYAFCAEQEKPLKWSTVKVLSNLDFEVKHHNTPGTLQGYSHAIEKTTDQEEKDLELYDIMLLVKELPQRTQKEIHNGILTLIRKEKENFAKKYHFEN